ncbi:adenylyl-sulfate kinase [Budviciaceae bacterium BWR-B9]|uniref:Adenylyl-sulfate kinase n=1 Tax=Limnobaculum allomyrinae TaxID=2791986 RepID=A0ABS1IML4_9GAMM|nr:MULTISPECIES: adenylyl-sulfate kinase [Limnobaculum]MBK5142909.1 adenylyl-sulfate kinase [Limnobaculum allomyrinae]MBV7690204.1 adenylyl-sulfate kinase [Limnobaculum sp. M2-1]
MENNIVWHAHPVTRIERERLNKHGAAVVWLTGLSGSGKSSIAGALEQALYHLNVHTYLLDGDNVRHGLCQDLSFSDRDRKENIRRVGEVSGLMMDAGLVVITAFISPYRDDRESVLLRLPAGHFIEVFVDTPIEVCEQRDPKGLYKKARKGEITQFTGVDLPYEAPLKPDVHLDGRRPVEELVAQLIDYLKGRGIIKS